MTWNLQVIIGPGGLFVDRAPLPAGFISADVFNNQLHVCYLSPVPFTGNLRANCSIWDVWTGGAITAPWNLQQVTGPGGLSGGTAANDVWGTQWISTVTYSDQMHVCYYDAQGYIWDAWYDGARSVWNIQQLTGSGGRTNGPVIGGVGPVAVTYNNQMHVCYSDTNGVIWDASYNGATGKWNLNQLNGAGGLTNGPAMWGIGPALVTYNNQMHVCYCDANCLIWDAWYDGARSVWNIQQLTGSGGRAGGPPAGLVPQSPNPPVAVTYSDQMHVCYYDANGWIWDAWYDGARGVWNIQQLTGSGGRAGGPPGRLFLSVVVYGNQMHVCYCDTNNLIWDAWYDGVRGVWNLQQLTGPSGLTDGPAVTSWTGGPVAVTYNNQMHVFYLAGVDALLDVWYNPTGP